MADLDRALCRIYLGNAWVRLGGGEAANVELAYESLADDPIEGPRFAAEFETLARRPPPLLSLTALVVPREKGDGDAPRVVWGANLSLRIGRRTRVRVEGLVERVVRGTVVSMEDGVVKPVTRGRVNVVLWMGERPDRQLSLRRHRERGGPVRRGRAARGLRRRRWPGGRSSARPSTWARGRGPPAGPGPGGSTTASLRAV